jgi:protein-glutamine gamma-glutamyltransferase
MKLKTGFLFFNYLLTATGLLCLSFSNVFPPWLGVLLGSVLVTCLMLEIKNVLPLKPHLKVLTSSWSLLALPLLYFGFDLPLLDLLVWVLIVLLFSRLIFKTELNDYLFGYVLNLICLLLGAMVAQDITFALLFLSFYLVLCGGLIHYHMLAEQTGNHSPPDVFKHYDGNEHLRGRLFGFSAVLMVLILALTTLIFAGFPRLRMEIFPPGPKSPVTGFSEAVRLGDVGMIKENSAVVMRVEFSQKGETYRPKSAVYLRGVVLDHFNGNSWFSTDRQKREFINHPGVGVKLFPNEPTANAVRQDIYMDRFDSNVIFAPTLPLIIDGDFRSLQVSRDFTLKTLDRNSRLNTVSLTSDPASSAEHRIQAKLDMRSTKQRKKFLQLPGTSSEIAQLAKRLTQNTAESSANNMLNYLRSNFGYTLEMEKGPGQSTLDHFLFIRKKGHCEYFASSMVVLLRLAGIPARLVNGFLGVEWNDLGQYMVIRQQHAHSWVEAFFPDKGWVRYDPTPSDPAFSENKFNDSLSRALDLMRLNWQRYILRYSMKDQTLFFTGLKSTGEETMASLQKLRTLDDEEIKTLIIDNLEILVLLIVFGFLLMLAWRNHPRWRFFDSPRSPFPAWLYQKMLRKLAVSGIHKQPHWTHREFLQRLTTLPKDKRDIIEKITATYEKSRFGQIPLLEAEKKELLNHLRKI